MFTCNEVLASFTALIAERQDSFKKVLRINVPAEMFDAIGFRPETQTCIHGETLIVRTEGITAMQPIFFVPDILRASYAATMLARKIFLESQPHYALLSWFIETLRTRQLQVNELKRRSWEMLDLATTEHPPVKFMAAWWTAEFFKARYLKAQQVLSKCRYKWSARAREQRNARLAESMALRKITDPKPHEIAKAKERFREILMEPKQANKSDDAWFSRAAIYQAIFAPAKQLTGASRSFVSEQMAYYRDPWRAGAL